MKNRDAIYVENSGEQAERRISHVALRTLRPDEMARFYSDVFGLKEVNSKSDDPNHYLTDGKVQLVLIPYKIKNYIGQSILPTGMDHVGFEVESIDALKKDLEESVGINPCLQPIPVGGGPEQGARLELLKKQCPMGEFFLSDPDFTMIAVSQRH
jgi:catechol 2,3-dioxygenase-like lactoylglutathione lyase family enzyme